jgi:hypothetical protein
MVTDDTRATADLPREPVPMLDRLSAVHSVLGIQRQATEYDILITTVLEVVRDGPLSETELLWSVRRVWPGAGISAERLVAALRIGKKIGYFLPIESTDEPAWSLTRLGVKEVEASRDWARDIIDATARALGEKVGEAGLELSAEAARVWTHHLEMALHASIRQAFSAYQGAVERQSEWWLTPRAFDRSALTASIEASTADSAHSSLLTALALEAIDPLASFGSALVTHITIGYMLHAFLGRRDHLGVRIAIGSLTGDRAILDTPILLQLLGSPSQRAPFERAIRAAVEAHMEVIALDHYLVELRELLARNERESYLEVRQTLASGVPPDLLASVVEDRVVALWLGALARGRYSSWSDFSRAADDLQTDLEALGVVVRSHGNKDEAEVRRVDAVLQEEALHRGALQRQRDSHTVVMAHRSRDRSAAGNPFWPGAWVITTDRHMADAYRRLYPGDRFPLTLTPGRLLGLISSCSSPTTMEELAVSAASLLQEDSFLAVAARYPVSAAIGIAEALGPTHGGSQLDLRLTQLSPTELLEEQLDVNLPDDAVGAKVTAAVITMRAERLNAAFAAGAARLRSDADTAGLMARTTSARLHSTEEESRQARADRDAARKELDAYRDQVQRERRTRDRTWIVRFGYAICALLLLLSLLQADLIWLVVAGVGLLVFWKAASEWTNNLEKSWGQLLPGILIEALGLLVGFFRN